MKLFWNRSACCLLDLSKSIFYVIHNPHSIINMKNRIKIDYLVILSICCLFMGCNSDDDHIDDILYNTKWEYRTVTTSNMTPDYVDGKKDFLNNLINSKRVECASIAEEQGEKFNVNYNPGNYKQYLTDRYIMFNKKKCVYSSQKYNKWDVYRKTHTVYTFKEQEPSDENYYFRVTSNGIYNQYSLVMALDNYKVIAESKNSLESTEFEFIENIEEEMDYERTENEIIMTNDKRTLHAIIDRDKWILKVTQLKPERIDIENLSLK